MKKLIIILFFLIHSNTFANTHFDITYNLGYNQKPTYIPLLDSEFITESKSNTIFEYVKNKSMIEWRYSYGSCEDRAHAVSLYLSNQKIPHKKIWNFDPYYISVFNKMERPTIVDKTGLSPLISWGFHVAVLVKIKKGNVYLESVIDPSLAEYPITIDKWLELQGAKSSYYTFSDPQWFTFDTINGKTFDAVAIPNTFPTLLTGDFSQNTGENLKKMWVEEGLSINEIAMQIKSEVIDKTNSSQKLSLYKGLITNIESLTSAMNNETVPIEFVDYSTEFKNYQKIFRQKRLAWKTKLDNWRSK